MHGASAPERPNDPASVQDLTAETAFPSGDDASNAGEFFGQLLEQLPDGVCISDEETGRIIACNAAMETLMAKTRDALIGQLRAAVLTPRVDASPVLPSGLLELRIVAADDQEKHVEIRSVRTKLRGRGLITDTLRDITAHAQEVTALREQHRQYEELISEVPGALYQFRMRSDGASNLPFASPQFLQSFGIEPSALREDASALFRVIHAEDVGAVQASVEHSAATLTPWSQEFRIMLADGSERWRHAHSHPEKRADGSVVWHGFIMDVTERKRAEEALRRSEESLRQTFELSPVGAAIVGTNRRFAQVNRAFAQFLGYDEAEIAQMTIDDVTHPDDRGIGREQMEAIIAGTLEKSQVEKRYVRKDGSIVWGEVTISLIRDSQGRPSHFLPVIQDITKRKLAEQEVELAWEKTLEGWVTALDMRDNETKGHSERVMQMAIELAEALGITGQELVQLKRGALLHDIGKMGIPDHILKSNKVFRKDESMTQEEAEMWAEMQSHTLRGYHMLRDIGYLQGSLDIPLRHHERWDGTGYPGHIDLETGQPLPGCEDANGNARGLAGEEIPLFARIFAVCDVWDGLRSKRVYRDAWTKEKVIAHLLERRGTHLDASVVDLFIARALYEKVDAAREDAAYRNENADTASRP